MVSAETWRGFANLAASVLLLLLGLLFLRARRSEFARAFAAYSMLAAGQKLSGGMWLYLVDEPRAQAAWQTASSLFLLASTPTLAHALSAFTFGPAFSRRPAWMKTGLYAPFALLVPAAIAGSPAFAAFTLGMTLVFLGILGFFLVAVLRLRRTTRIPAVRAQAGYLLTYLAIALSFSVEVRVILLLYGNLPWWELSIAYAVAAGILLYGILRMHLFDIDLKLKWTLRRGTLLGAFVAVFVIVSGIVEQWAQRYNVLVGGAAVGLMLLALRPLERAADRLADAAMPRVRDTDEYRTVRRREVYRAAVESAIRDGIVTDSERDVLATLADQLGLTAGEARALEREALLATGAHAQPEGFTS